MNTKLLTLLLAAALPAVAAQPREVTLKTWLEGCKTKEDADAFEGTAQMKDGPASAKFIAERRCTHVSKGKVVVIQDEREGRILFRKRGDTELYWTAKR